MKHTERQASSIGTSVRIHCVQGAACFAAWKSVPNPPPPHFQSATVHSNGFLTLPLTLMLCMGIPLVFWPNVLKNEYSTK